MRRFDIPPIDSAAARAAADRQRILTKPPGSLGRLEDVACRLAGIQGTELPTVSNRWIVVAAADHGVTGDSVSAYPQEVTGQMVRNFLSGGRGDKRACAALRGQANGCGRRNKWSCLYRMGVPVFAGMTVGRTGKTRGQTATARGRR